MARDAAIRPFSGPGYSNAALAVAGIAVAFPLWASGADIQVDVGCFVGVRGSAVLDVFNNTNYGSTLFGSRITRQMGVGGDTHIHIAPWSGTAQVAIAFF